MTCLVRLRKLLASGAVSLTLGIPVAGQPTASPVLVMASPCVVVTSDVGFRTATDAIKPQTGA